LPRKRFRLLQASRRNLYAAGHSGSLVTLVCLLQERKAVSKQGLTIKRLVGSEISSSTWDKVRAWCCAVKLGSDGVHVLCCNQASVSSSGCALRAVSRVFIRVLSCTSKCRHHALCPAAVVFGVVMCVAQFYEFYQTTIDKWWGRPYLKREFFHRIGEDMGDEVLLVVAEEQGDTVAAALNLIGR
jgi:hypothetical protein